MDFELTSTITHFFICSFIHSRKKQTLDWLNISTSELIFLSFERVTRSLVMSPLGHYVCLTLTQCPYVYNNELHGDTRKREGSVSYGQQTAVTQAPQTQLILSAVSPSPPENQYFKRVRKWYQ